MLENSHNNTENHQSSSSVSKIGWIVVATSLGSIILMVVFMLIPPFNDGSGNPDAGLFSSYATFIGGICAIILGILNAYLIFRTYKAQQEQSVSADLQYKNTTSRQVDFFTTERFEGRFFVMLRANRKIVEEMSYEVPDEYTSAVPLKKDDKANKHHIILVNGQRVFVQIYKHIQEARKECNWIKSRYKNVKTIFKGEHEYHSELSVLTKYFEQIGYEIEMDEEIIREIQWINIIYQCIFFGVDELGIKIITKNLEAKYDATLIELVIRTLRIKPVAWSIYADSYNRFEKGGFEKLLSLEDISYERKKYRKYYGGHQHRLGHYFRNIYNIYNYLDEQPHLDWKAKYSYSKQFRSQLSTYEQALFFYNSLSMMGRIWEIEAGNGLIDKNKIHNKQYITKYNLVKNIPSELLSEEKLTTIYPLVDFELKATNPGKETLEKIYT